jgi:hypothetical protein
MTGPAMRPDGSAETDTQRLGAARRAGEGTSRSGDFKRSRAPGTWDR